MIKALCFVSCAFYRMGSNTQWARSDGQALAEHVAIEISNVLEWWNKSTGTTLDGILL